MFIRAIQSHSYVEPLSDLQFEVAGKAEARLGDILGRTGFLAPVRESESQGELHPEAFFLPSFEFTLRGQV